MAKKSNQTGTATPKSTRVVDPNSKVVTTTYTDGKVVIDTPRTSGGFDRVTKVPGQADVTSFVPPRLKPGGNAKAPIATVTIPKGTPVAAIAAVVKDQLDQLTVSGATVTSAYGSFKVF